MQRYPIIKRFFIHPHECDSVVHMNKNSQSSLSKIIQNDKIIYNPKRRKSTSQYQLHKHNEIQYIQERIDMHMFKTHKVYNSSVQMATYNVGDFFTCHTDALDDEQLMYFGPQRLWTAVLYLDSFCVGGETCFPDLNTCISPEKGTLVYWPNVDLNGNIIYDHRHSSRKVTYGQKNVLVFLYFDTIKPSEYINDQFGWDSISIV